MKVHNTKLMSIHLKVTNLSRAVPEVQEFGN